MNKYDIYHVRDFLPALSKNKKYKPLFDKACDMGLTMEDYIFAMAFVLYRGKLDPIQAYGQAYNRANESVKAKEFGLQQVLAKATMHEYINELRDTLGLTDMLPLNEMFNKTRDLLDYATKMVPEYDKRGVPTGQKKMKDPAIAYKTLSMLGTWFNLPKMNLHLTSDMVSDNILDVTNNMTASEAAKVYIANINKKGGKTE